MIAWDSVAPIRDVNPSQVRLSVKRAGSRGCIPPNLPRSSAISRRAKPLAVVGQLDDETAADAFEHLDAETRKNLIDDIGTERAADIIEEMDADDAADLLAELPEEQQSQLLAEMNAYTAGELRELVKYPEDTAGGMMTTDYVWIYPHRTTEATIRKIREIAPASEFIYYLYVARQRGSVCSATLSLRTLLLALPTAFIDRIMETDLVTVAPDTTGGRRRRRRSRSTICSPCRSSTTPARCWASSRSTTRSMRSCRTRLQRSCRACDAIASRHPA